MFTLRPLSAADVPSATALWETAWHEAHGAITPPALARLRTRENFQSRLELNAPQTMIAVEGADVLGFCITRQDEIYQLFVDARARGHGLAQALLDDGCARVQAGGARRAWLACAVGNNRAAAFYEKSGWSNIGPRTEMMDTDEGPFALEVWRFEKNL